MSDSWRPVAGLTDLPPGSRKLVRIDGHSLLLFNVDVGLHAAADSCPHAGAWLGGGTLSGTVLRCPAHGLHARGSRPDGSRLPGAGRGRGGLGEPGA
jgi:nitrite reductase/ring-hydroxylating ferredoxin subunit